MTYSIVSFKSFEISTAFLLLLSDGNLFIGIIGIITLTITLTVQLSASSRDERVESTMMSHPADTRCGGKSKGFTVLLVFSRVS